MLESEAIVTHTEGGYAYIDVSGAGAGVGCGHCHEAGGCQSGVLGQVFGSDKRLFKVANILQAVPGERVVIGIAEGATVRAAGLAYGLPLVCLIGGAAVGTAFAPPGGIDLWATLGAIAGLPAGFGLAYLAQAKGKAADRCRPAMLRKAPD